jgi:hypothetical protein
VALFPDIELLGECDVRWVVEGAGGVTAEYFILVKYVRLFFSIFCVYYSQPGFFLLLEG